MVVKEEYRVFFRGERIGSYYVFTNRRSSSEIYALPAGSEAELASLGLDKGATAKRSIRFFFDLMKDENRVPGTRKRAPENGLGKPTA